jgi:hypothetical protein
MKTTAVIIFVMLAIDRCRPHVGDDVAGVVGLVARLGCRRVARHRRGTRPRELGLPRERSLR